MRATNTFSSSISQVNNSVRKKGVSVGRLFKLLDRRSNYIITFVSFWLILLPLPLPPGFTTILALPSIFITMQMCYKHDRIWIPKFISQIHIKKSIIKTIDSISRKYLCFIEKLTRKRMVILVSPKLQKIYDIILLIFALSSAVPVPFLCMIPAVGGILLSAGLIVKDGLITTISLFIGSIGMFIIWEAIKTFIAITDYIPFLDG